MPGLGPPGNGGVFSPLLFGLARFVCDLDLEDVVVGGEFLSKNELKVEELLLPLLLACDCGSSIPSLLEFPDESRVSFLSLANEAFERRRNWKSLRKEGIAAVTAGEAGLGMRQRRCCQDLQPEMSRTPATPVSVGRSGGISAEQALAMVYSNQGDCWQRWAGRRHMREEATGRGWRLLQINWVKWQWQARVSVTVFLVFVCARETQACKQSWPRTVGCARRVKVSFSSRRG